MAFPDDLFTDVDFPPTAGAYATGEKASIATRYAAALKSIRTQVGAVGSSVPTSHEYRIASLEGGGARVVDVSLLGVLPAASAAVNTFIFNTYASTHLTPIDFYFPPGEYQTNGFAIYGSNQRIIGAGGISETFGGGATKFTMNGTGDCVVFNGPDSATPQDWDTRMISSGAKNLFIYNGGTSTNRGLVVKNATECQFDQVDVQNFRGDGGGLFAYNLSDTRFNGCTWSWCGGTGTGTNAVIRFQDTPATGVAQWNVDTVTFWGCRFEVNDVRLLTTVPGTFYCIKIGFFGCKFESNSLAGPNSTAQAQFYIDNSSFMHFVGCDFTLQTRSTAYELPCAFRVVGTSTLFLTDCMWSFASQKVFTNFINANAAGGLVGLSNFWVNGGTGFPTTVLKGSNSPHLAQHSVGFTPNTGSGRVTTDWYTTAEWVQAGSGGIVA